MIRVFTVTFEFNHQTYEALVSVVQTGDSSRYNIRLLDTELHAFIPGGGMRYSGKNGYEDMGWIDSEPSKKLMSRVSDAIEKHLCPEEVVAST